MKYCKWFLVLLLLILISAGSWVFYQGWTFMHTPPSTEGKEVTIDILPGHTLGTIATNLEAKGIITDAQKFILLARYKKTATQVQAGRFLLNTGWLPDKVLETLVLGKPVLSRITIPEGLTWWQTARLLADNGFAKYEDLKEIFSDKKFLRHYGIPFDNAEGFLMPDTYLLRTPSETLSKEDAWKVAGRLVDTFWLKAQSAWGEKKPPVEELKKFVILASIVEKETAIPSERARVAGVYTNRLAKGMLLQADPCVIYGIGEQFSGNLTRKMLNDATNPYNTYAKAGLPPGPICSFGASALKAAVKPESHDYLYFVAITDGGAHQFSKTLSEHNRAVRQYLNNRKKAKD